jgi:hypothetical protein
MGKSINIIKKNTEAVIVKWFVLEVNADEITYACV